MIPGRGLGHCQVSCQVSCWQLFTDRNFWGCSVGTGFLAYIKCIKKERWMGHDSVSFSLWKLLLFPFMGNNRLFLVYLLPHACCICSGIFSVEWYIVWIFEADIVVGKRIIPMDSSCNKAIVYNDVILSGTDFTAIAAVKHWSWLASCFSMYTIMSTTIGQLFCFRIFTVE